MFNPYVSQLVELNVSRLESACESEFSRKGELNSPGESLVDVDCAFDVSDDYNFRTQSWVRKDRSPIENIRWSSDVYPLTNNRLSIVVFELVERSSSVISTNHFSRTVVGLPMDPPVYASFSRDYDRTSLFFCSSDTLTFENLKFGTYEEAVSLCDRIMTPRICDDQTISDTILSLAQELT